MTYTPPQADGVTFDVEPYDPPSGDAVDFDFTQFVLVEPAPVTLDLDTPDAFVAPIKQFARPDAVELDLTTPEPFVSPGVPVRPEPVTLDLSTPPALIAPFLLSEEWQIDRERLQPSEIEADADTLSLSFQVQRDQLPTWRQFDRADDVDVEEGFGGAFRAIGRDGRDDVEVRIPFTRLRPFEPAVDYRVTGYQEEQQSTDLFEIELDLHRVTNRTEAFPALEQSGDDWTLSLAHGTIALANEQVGQLDREGDTPGASVTLPLILSDEQAAALLDSVGYPAGVVVESVPDGPDQRVDETGGRQTIDLDAPAEAMIDAGEWFVIDWSLEWWSFSEDREWRVELTLAES